MTIGIGGNYVLRMKMGSNDVPISQSALEDFSIIQDYNRLLPYFQLQLADTTGSLTHVLPFDKEMSRLSVEIGSAGAEEITNTFAFTVYRRFPESINMASTHYDAQGLLNIPNLFTPTWCRASYGSVYTILQSIALQELLADATDISPSLNVVKKILQAKWSNAELFTYLRRMLGDDGGYAYHPYFYVKNGAITFAFKSIQDMCQAQSSYNFIVNDTPYNDYLPVTDYAIFDNYKGIGIKGIKSQGFGYFDWENSGYVIDADNPNDYLSLSDYLSVDKQDQVDSDEIHDTGRTNELTQTFKGRVRSEYYERINNLVKLWIHTWGLPNIVPGEVVKVLFAQGLASGNLATYQYSGYWLVERVVHSFGNTFLTKLLLTRAGIDTDQATSLVQPYRRKT